VLGALAYRTISRRPDEFTGRPLAIGAVVLAAVSLVAALVTLTRAYAAELPAGYERLTYGMLQPLDGDPPGTVPDTARSADGRNVLLKGYMYPGKQQSGITQFLLVRDQGDCCFGGNPKITDRVVTVSSMAHLAGRISLRDLNCKARPYAAWPAYGQSKLANLLFTSELQRRLTAAGSLLKAHSAHPGYAATNLQGRTGNRFGTPFWLAGNRVFATSAEAGARPTLHAASVDLPPDSFIGPRYGARGPIGEASRSRRARDSTTARALWTLSEQFTGIEFPL
jgi:NAD(P)-dependent dehydrogenase (short-subunit alcohol dehydrogenase family)